jgi:hypothetical protein
MGASFAQAFTSNTSSGWVRFTQQDRDVVLDARGTFSTGTARLQVSPDGGTTAVSVGTGLAADGQEIINNVSGTHMRINFSGGAGAEDLTARVFWDDE